MFAMVTNKNVSISLENYKKLKTYGLAGDSLNFAISRLFKLADRASAGGVVD
jgi:hypothetical protein